MGQSAMAAAKQAAQAALAEIVDGTYFAVISGNGAAFLAYPLVQSGPAMVPMDDATRAEASDAISHLRSGGGTEISTWLDMAGVLFTSVPQVVQRHAILLTDGENNEPAPCSTRRSPGRPASTSATAAASASTGRSRRSAASPRPCSAPSTSSRRRSRWPPSSRR